MCTFPARVVKGELGLPDKYCQEVEGVILPLYTAVVIPNLESVDLGSSV